MNEKGWTYSDWVKATSRAYCERERGKPRPVSEVQSSALVRRKHIPITLPHITLLNGPRNVERDTD